MHGVAFEVDQTLPIFDLSHEIPPYDIWIGALTLKQTAPYWPEGTVFVSVVDPGVGTERKSVVLKTESGHFFVTPDNGTLTFVAETLGLAAVREIDEASNRLADSTQSYTFHGRDVYAFTGARLAAGVITFEEVGSELEGVMQMPYQAPEADPATGEVRGTILNPDIRYGNVWTNIDRDTFESTGFEAGDELSVAVSHDGKIVYEAVMPYARTFGEVSEGSPLAYFNSLLNLSFALNIGNFADAHAIGYGPDWRVAVSAVDE